MIHRIIGPGAFCAVALCAWSAAAGTTISDQAIALHANGQEPLVVAPGEEIGIACAALANTAPDSDVRVVLTIAPDTQGRPAPGFKKVLATNERFTNGGLRVRIPKLAGLDNRTVNVNVYVVNGDAANSCNAGDMRIADAAHSKKSKSKNS